eukprot:GHVL01028438.1.p1 GENE.GHVL01028438.1~~GHVL01028438.1.p1  ORF type:complete len:464 (+),score=85.29 GHVL01028438.1:1522-2913(+)
MGGAASRSRSECLDGHIRLLKNRFSQKSIIKTPNSSFIPLFYEGWQLIDVRAKVVTLPMTIESSKVHSLSANIKVLLKPVSSDVNMIMRFVENFGEKASDEVLSSAIEPYVREHVMVNINELKSGFVPVQNLKNLNDSLHDFGLKVLSMSSIILKPDKNIEIAQHQTNEEGEYNILKNNNNAIQTQNNSVELENSINKNSIQNENLYDFSIEKKVEDDITLLAGLCKMSPGFRQLNDVRRHESVVDQQCQMDSLVQQCQKEADMINLMYRVHATGICRLKEALGDSIPHVLSYLNIQRGYLFPNYINNTPIQSNSSQYRDIHKETDLNTTSSNNADNSFVSLVDAYNKHYAQSTSKPHFFSAEILKSKYSPLENNRSVGHSQSGPGLSSEDTHEYSSSLGTASLTKSSSEVFKRPNNEQKLNNRKRSFDKTSQPRHDTKDRTNSNRPDHSNKSKDNNSHQIKL